MTTNQPHSKLAILAGGGDIPALLASACLKRGRPCVVISFEGQPQPVGLNGLEIEHVCLPIGKVGTILKLLHKEGVKQVVMIGNLSKPSLFSLKPDWKGAQLLAKVALHHDDQLLRMVAGVLEAEGFSVCGVHTVLPELMMPQKVLGKHKPNNDDSADIEIGWRISKVLGAEDVGQAVIVKRRVVLGVEGVEGTDKLIDRCAVLRGEDNKGGVLVKVAKPQQDLRFDMPSIGPETLRRLSAHGYRGIVAEAGNTLLVHAEETVKLADELGLFMVGLSAEEMNG